MWKAKKFCICVSVDIARDIISCTAEEERTLAPSSGLSQSKKNRKHEMQFYIRN